MRRNVIVIGASAGGVDALRTVVAGLPADLPATVLVVLHVPAYGGSVLPTILARAGELPARHAAPGDKLTPGLILVAPPDQHLIVSDSAVELTRGPRENGHRPAIDVLFRSAARTLGPQVIGVVLSGVLDDGTAGLSAVASQSGAAVVQDPADAMYSTMPLNAISHVPAAHVARAEDIPSLLVRLCREEIPDERPQPPRDMEFETEVALMNDEAVNGQSHPGVPSSFSCPDCNGVLWEVPDGDVARYRCRVGHAWSEQSLLGEQTQQLETAMWMALRGLEEKAALARVMHDRAETRHNSLTARRFADQADDATRAASLIRSMLESHLGLPVDEPVAEN